MRPQPEPSGEEGQPPVEEEQVTVQVEDAPLLEQGNEIITIVLKEFITGNAFQVSIAADSDIADLTVFIRRV